jgi:hypothetical protein
MGKQLCVWCHKVMPPGENDLCSEICAKQYHEWLAAEIKKWPILEEQPWPDIPPLV